MYPKKKKKPHIPLQSLAENTVPVLLQFNPVPFANIIRAEGRALLAILLLKLQLFSVFS